MQKIINAIACITFVLTLGSITTVYFGYKYVTSEQFKSRVMNEILGNVQGMMPKVLEKGLPDLTGPSLPMPPKMEKPKMEEPQI